MSYVDHSREGAILEVSTSQKDNKGISVQRDIRQHSFAVLLHYLLSEPEEVQDIRGILSWLPHGRAFRIIDKERLVREVLPKWFRQTKFESFQRQCNIYSFRRIVNGQDKGAFYNERFLRGMPQLAAGIKRIQVKGKGPRKSSKATEPNFYTMPSLPANPRKPSSPISVDPAQARGTSEETLTSTNDSQASTASDTEAPGQMHQHGTATVGTSQLLAQHHFSSMHSTPQSQSQRLLLLATNQGQQPCGIPMHQGLDQSSHGGVDASLVQAALSLPAEEAQPLLLAVTRIGAQSRVPLQPHVRRPTVPSMYQPVQPLLLSHPPPLIPRVEGFRVHVDRLIAGQSDRQNQEQMDAALLAAFLRHIYTIPRRDNGDR